MEAAVAALDDFEADASALEPEGWNRSNYGADYRRRPSLQREDEYVDD